MRMPEFVPKKKIERRKDMFFGPEAHKDAYMAQVGEWAGVGAFKSLPCTESDFVSREGRDGNVVD